MPCHKPTKTEIQAAYNQKVPDIIGPNLNVLFCGINASIYSAAVGHHFARPGNRLWKALYRAGFTERLLDPSEDTTLLDRGYGMTNIVARATARADELDAAELEQGYYELVDKIEQFRPTCLAVLGISAYRIAFKQPKAKVGPQAIAINDTQVWALPNPSGLNAHYQIDDLATAYRELFNALSDTPSP
ncbi:G/U mismatch-specific DNA glycosylase [Oscillatoria sp. CS-180]|uniref:G/U mismatch-specific DNA glycosylase n=1 Tax=Oscillatoria sp. CS-180 TaxID=3021720 RepID=UPI00232B1B08|nr:G/U mismatch-specific DNA glycosylase [Oscillatoria sp. CS-180]MDB9528017.1 G/U mismatch-specific DNA glycosylase [Oscillatoria sp. CS-180]